MSITVSLLRQTVNEGEVATFTAIGNGIKTREFKYEWFKRKGNKLTTVGRNAQLMITNVKIKDQGSYLCGITNEWENIKHSRIIELTVIGKIRTNLYSCNFYH